MQTLPPAIRLGDHLALDFLNTVASPKGSPVDWIPDGKSLIAWLVETGVLDQVAADRILAWRSEAELDRAAKEARELREWFRALLGKVKASGRAAMRTSEVARLNEAMGHDAMFHRIEPGDTTGSFHMVTARRWRNASEFLAPIASAMGELICDADLGLIRQCENHACTIWFYDRTKGHRRRWCSQAFCGNRAKVAAFRERQRSAG